MPLRMLIAVVCLTASACAGLFPRPRGDAARAAADEAVSVQVLQRAESLRADQLEREVRRLRTDLRQAEEALIAAESGLRGDHSRADAVSSLAEARIQVERAARRAPWRRERIEEARSKLEDADAQVQLGNFGAAVFFVHRARRIAEHLEREAREIGATALARRVRAERVNLRRGPSTHEDVIGILARGTPVFPEASREHWLLVRTPNGRVGWVHASLLRKP